MIKFFRRIRQQLLQENRFSKYLMYAIGEIVLVVIGILIALGINNWNSNRINAAKQTDYLSAIKSDLEKQIPILKLFITSCDSISNVGYNILNEYNDKQSFVLTDNLNRRMTVLFSAEKFPGISTTFDELISTGQINLIKNKAVRSKVISYYQNARDSHEGMNLVTSDIVYGHVYPTLKSSLIILPENMGLPSPLKEVPSKLQSAIQEKLLDPYREAELFNAINIRVKAASVNRSILLKSLVEAEALLLAINKELNLS